MLHHLLPGALLDDVGLDEIVPEQPEIDAAAKRFRIFLNRDGRRGHTVESACRRTDRSVAAHPAVGAKQTSLIGPTFADRGACLDWSGYSGIGEPVCHSAGSAKVRRS